MKTLWVISAAILSFTTSCYQTKDTSPSLTDKYTTDTTLKQKGLLADRSFLFGPEFDTTAFRAAAPCDCCAFYIHFLDSSQFILEDFCLSGNSFISGTYRIRNTDLTLITDSSRVEITEPNDFEPSLTRTIRKSRVQSHTSKWILKNVNGRILVTSTKGELYFGSADTTGLFTHLARLKKDRIPELLSISR